LQIVPATLEPLAYPKTPPNPVPESMSHSQIFPAPHFSEEIRPIFEVVGAAFLELGSSGSSSAGPCLGEIFLLETVFLEGVYIGVV